RLINTPRDDVKRTQVAEDYIDECWSLMSWLNEHAPKRQIINEEAGVLFTVDDEGCLLAQVRDHRFTELRHRWQPSSNCKEQPKVMESIEEFADRCKKAGIVELWVSVGADAQSGLVMLHISPRGDLPEYAEKAQAAGITTRSFYVEDFNLHPADQQSTFSEA